MPKLAAALATTYLAADTAIVPVLQQLFSSLEFRTHQGTKVKRPVEDLVSSCRTLGITPDPGTGKDGLQALWWESDSLGHMPLAWPMPNGYSDVAVDWQSTNQTLERWNLHMAFAGQWWPVGNVDPKNPQNTPMLQAPALATLLPSPLPTTYGPFVDAMAQRLVYQKMAPAARDAVVTFLGKTAHHCAEVDRRRRHLEAALRRRAHPRLRVPRVAVTSMTATGPEPARRSCGCPDHATPDEAGGAGARAGSAAVPSCGVRRSLAAATGLTATRAGSPGWPSPRPRRTPATCWSCSRSAAASTGCPRSSRDGDPDYTLPAEHPGAGRRVARRRGNAHVRPAPGDGAVHADVERRHVRAVHAVGQPNPTRSHFEAMEEMEKAAPGSSLRTGWIDRVLVREASAARSRPRDRASPACRPGSRDRPPSSAMYSIDNFDLSGAGDDRSPWDAALRALNVGGPLTVQAPGRHDARRARDDPHADSGGGTPPRTAPLYDENSELATPCATWPG